MEQLDFESLVVGKTFAPLVKPPVEKVQLVKYAGASGDYNLIHTDEETARKANLPGVIAHGMLSMGFLGQYVSEIAGTNGFVSRLKVRFSSMVRPGDVLTCHGRVVAKTEDSKQIELAVQVENEAHTPVTVGEATLTFYEPTKLE
jgi:acyl dehydratase